jgi:hypothetical protein
MRNHGLRATWIAPIMAIAVAVGTPMAATFERGPSPAPTTTSIEAIRAEHPFTDRGPQVDGRRDAGATERARTGHRRTHHRDRDAGAELLVRVPVAMSVRARPGTDAPVVGTMPSGSKYYDVPITAWVEETADHGRWGRVDIPYVWPRRDGWIPLHGLERSTTHVEVHVDLSRHWVSVSKFGHTLFGLRAATGAPISPTPLGRYFVTDRIPFAAGGSLGSFAFGISGIQPELPPGWSGGNQLAIHGTSDPSSIGTSASAGCVRVSEQGLDRLLPLLKLGTPVVIEA